MNRSLVLLGALCACGSHPTPVATVSGQLALASSTTTVSAPVNLAIVWFPTTSPVAGAAPSAVLTSEVTYQGTFPQSFTFDLYGPPPAGALSTNNGMTGAIGTLVAYEDTDGDGQLTISTSGPVKDKVLGVSGRLYALAAGQLPLEEAMTMVVYSQEQFVAPGPTPVTLPKGYSQYAFTLHADATSSLAVNPISTPVNLELKDDPALAAVACAQAYTFDVSNPTPCGITLSTKPVVYGAAIIDSLGGSSVTIGVSAALGGSALSGSTVTLNGTSLTFDAASQLFALSEASPMVVKDGANQLHVTAPGFDPIDATFTMPGAFQITSPAAGASVQAGSSLTVAWTAASGAGSYLAIGGAGDTSPMPTTQLSQTVTVPAQAGALGVMVSALGQYDLTTLISGQRQTAISLQVVP